MPGILAVLAKSCQEPRGAAYYPLLTLGILCAVDGEALRRARDELGISRDQLTAYSGVSRETLRKIEESDYTPKAKTLADIKRGLEKAAEELSVTQRLAALERQVDVLESLVRALLAARTEQPVGPPAGK